ncbi:MAG: hypothetical protein HY904_17790 [Deltaproteobacteria bacterium]|nr:hypothetical protein [Deltaproteobacteria bacterium]
MRLGGLRELLAVMAFLAVLNAASTAAAAPLVHPAPEALATVAAQDGPNPWDAVIWGHMYVPFPWDALLDGYVPWGRYAWVKNLSGGCFICCGGWFIATAPLAIFLALLSLALAVLGAMAAVYVFFTSGFKDGCVGVFNRGTDVQQSFFSLFNAVMCFSFVACTPWLGFKMIQRGWYAIRQDIDPPMEKEERPPKPSQQAEDQGMGLDQEAPPESTPEGGGSDAALVF